MNYKVQVQMQPNSVTEVMAEMLQPLIYLPDKAELKGPIPVAFQKFFLKYVYILHCTEVFSESHSDLKERGQT